MSPSSLGTGGAASTMRCADDAHANNCTKPIPPRTIAQPSASGVNLGMKSGEEPEDRGASQQGGEEELCATFPGSPRLQHFQRWAGGGGGCSPRCSFSLS